MSDVERILQRRQEISVIHENTDDEKIYSLSQGPLNLDNLGPGFLPMQLVRGVNHNKSGFINHDLMRRLIIQCYEEPDFATKVVETYANRGPFANCEDMGIDRELLIIHAIRQLIKPFPWALLAVAMCCSVIPYIGLFLGFSFLWFGFVFLFLTRHRGIVKRYLQRNRYDPRCDIEPYEYNAINGILKNVQLATPDNVYFWGRYNPLEHFGQLFYEPWSIVVDRRKRNIPETGDTGLKSKSNYKIDPDPPLFDVAKLYTQIDEEAEKTVLSKAKILKKKILMVNGDLLSNNDQDGLLEKGELQLNQPVSSLSEKDIERMDTGYYHRKALQRISAYNPYTDICTTTLFSVKNTGLHLVVEGYHLVLRYQVTPRQVVPLNWFVATLGWLQQKLPHILVKSFLFLLVFSVCSGTIMMLSQFSWLHESSLFLSPVSIFGFYWFFLRSKPPIKKIDSNTIDIFRKLQKEGAFDYNPADQQNKSIFLMTTLQNFLTKTLRTVSVRLNGQARTYANIFDQRDTLHLMDIQRSVIQEAILSCLKSEGIDTSAYEKQVQQVNNAAYYGTVYQGSITQGEGSSFIGGNQNNQNED